MSYFPPLSDLFRYGPVPSTLIYLGILFVTIGAFGELSLQNEKVLFGFFLLSLGFMWFYGQRSIDMDPSPPHHRIYNWGRILASMFFFPALAAAGAFSLGKGIAVSNPRLALGLARQKPLCTGLRKCLKTGSRLSHDLTRQKQMFLVNEVRDRIPLIRRWAAMKRHTA